jgi:hypothetical protein
MGILFIFYIKNKITPRYSNYKYDLLGMSKNNILKQLISNVSILYNTGIYVPIICC